jgi:hypothetical protein
MGHPQGWEHPPFIFAGIPQRPHNANKTHGGPKSQLGPKRWFVNIRKHAGKCLNMRKCSMGCLDMRRYALPPPPQKPWAAALASGEGWGQWFPEIPRPNLKGPAAADGASKKAQIRQKNEKSIKKRLQDGARSTVARAPAGSKWSPKLTKMGPKMDPKWSPKLTQNGVQNEPQREPKMDPVI